MLVLPSAYFPSLAYIRTLLNHSDICIDLHEHFVKQSIRTRAEILGANGILQLNVPIIHVAHAKQTVAVLQIDNSKNWQAEHLRSITSAYANAPYFEHYAYDIQLIFEQRYLYVFELNKAILEWVNSALDLQLKISLSTEFTGQTPTDKKAWLGRAPMTTPVYRQVFSEQHEFVQNLPVIDGLMNEGPMLRAHFLPR